MMINIWVFPLMFVAVHGYGFFSPPRTARAPVFSFGLLADCQFADKDDAVRGLVGSSRTAAAGIMNS